MKKYTIWCDTIFMTSEEIENYARDIREICAEMDEETPEGYAMDERIAEDNAMHLDNVRGDMEYIDLPESILCIGDIERWNGCVCGYREFDDLESCLYSSVNGISYCEWYVDQYGNFRGTEAHHDGANAYLYRMWKPGLSDEQRENLLDKIYNGQATTADINRYTVRLGDYIGAVYGWKFCGTAPACVRV